MLLQRHRTRNGLSTIMLFLIIAVFAAVPIGLVVFEIQRVELAREQLRCVCEAAALAGAATLASSDITDPTQAQTNAMNTALTTFQANSVLGYSLGSAVLVSSKGQIPLAGQSNLYVEFLDPHNNMQVVSLGNVNGKVVRATGTLSVVPAFSSFLPLGQVPLVSSSSGGVPTLDVVLCFDLSGSMDDQTLVTFVNRQWSQKSNKTSYVTTLARSGSPAGSLASGTLFNILGPPATGSRTNAVYPQWLSISNQSNHQYPLNFSEDGAAPGLRGSTNNSPPGNYPPGKASTGDNYTYTDLVVNLDGCVPFGGITADGFSFPDIGTVVEAARGNLENSSVFKTSCANTALTSIQPRSGYQAEYFKLASAQLHPIQEAQEAAATFLTIINTNTDAHFGLVAFADNAGTGPGGTMNEYNIDACYASGGTGQFAIPQVVLDPTTNNTNYTTITQLLPTTGANTGTNIGDAVNQAVLQLKNYGRKGSTKAIVLFTDGEPTVGGPLASDPLVNARSAAVAAKQAGIPIYTIGLAQNAQIIPSETAILNDTNSDPAVGGIAAIAGNGGKFFLVTNAQNLRFTFENVARQLTQLVR